MGLTKTFLTYCSLHMHPPILNHKTAFKSNGNCIFNKNRRCSHFLLDLNDISTFHCGSRANNIHMRINCENLIAPGLIPSGARHEEITCTIKSPTRHFNCITITRVYMTNLMCNYLASMQPLQIILTYFKEQKM